MWTFDYPQMYAVAGSAEEQVAQLRAYIWRLVEVLNQAMDGSQAAVVGGDVCRTEKKLDKKGGTVDGSLDVRGGVHAQGALQSDTMLSAPSVTVHNDAEEASATLSCGGVCAARLTCLSQDGVYQNVRLAVGAPVGDDDAATKKYVDGAVAVADRVIGQGKTGAWTWRKWASGIAEMWATFGTDELAMTSQTWGALYTASWMGLAANKAAREYPFAFADQPVVTATPIAGGANFWCATNTENDTGTSLTHAPAYQCVRASDATLKNPRISYYVVGRYKA